MSDTDSLYEKPSKPMRNKRKHITLTIKQKLEIIDLVEDGKSSRQAIAHIFGIGKSTVHDIHKRREAIRSFAASHGSDEVIISQRRRVEREDKHMTVSLVDEPKEQVIKVEVEDTVEEYEYQEIPAQEYEIDYDSQSTPVEEKPPPSPPPESPTPQKLDISQKTKRKSKTLTFRDKFKVIQMIDSGVPVTVVCEEYGIGRTTVYDYLKRRDDIISFIQSSNDGDRKTFKRSKYPEVEDTVLEWCDSRDTFTRQEFYDYAKSAFEAAKTLECQPISGFCGSWAWAKRFFHRHPDLKTKLMSQTGEPIDPMEMIPLNKDFTEYLDVEPEPPLIDNVCRKMNSLTQDETDKILDEIDSGKPIAGIVEQYKVPKSTIYEIFKKRKDLTGERLPERFWRKSPRIKFPEVEEKLLNWCLEQNRSHLTFSLIADQAMCLFDILKCKGKFNPSVMWAKRFVLRSPQLCEKLEVDIEDSESAREEEHIREDSEYQDIETEAIEEGFEVEEYIVEEQEPIDEEIESETIEQIIKAERNVVTSQDEPLIPHNVAQRSLEILMRYTEQQGHYDMLSQLINYQNALLENSS